MPHGPAASTLGLLAALLTAAPATMPAQGAPGAQPQQASPSTPLTLDPAVKTGRLANGLRYFVRRNTRPANRAELRLVVNAGSILESDEQRGVAHFVEHMAFNGTRRFPKGDIMNFLERIGMRLGADVNAYTSFDETVYMLQVPTDTARFVATGLDILEDWAHAITFDATEMQKERGVVIEEWRTGRDATTRVSYRQIPVMLNNSLYAERLPIGSRESLETFAAAAAVQFYRDWYRPDLMSVIAVGDFDPDSMVKQIEARFAKIPMPANPRPRTLTGVPDHADTYVSIETDKEYPGKDVTLLWLEPHATLSAVGDLRRTFVRQFHDEMLNQRFAEIMQRPDAPFAYAGSGRGELVRTKDAYQLRAGVKDNEFQAAAEALLAEGERARRFGFTQGELDRTRTNYMRSLEQAYTERDKTESARFAAAYVRTATSGEPDIGIERKLALANQLVPTITLDDVNAVARRAPGDSNRVVVVAGPDAPGTTMPTRGAMLAVFAKAATATVTAYVDSTTDAPLVPVAPRPGRITAERTLPETGILEWTLSNGAKMLVKQTDFKDDEVLLSAQSPGGFSLVSDRDDLDASFGSIAVTQGGLGEFNPVALQKKLTGKRAVVQASVSSYSEALSGGGSRKDIETIFQLAYLRFTHPRVDSASYGAFVNLVRSVQANQDNDPQSVFNDTISMVLTQHHPRARLLRAASLDSVDIRRALALYRQRFAGANDFTFFLVGSFSLDSARTLTERYIASLPTTGRHETARDLGIRMPSGTVTREVRRGIEPKAMTRIVFHGPCDYSYANRIVLDALEGFLDIRLREVLREDKGGTYGASVSASCSHIPYERSQIAISFESAPERQAELTSAMWSVIDSIKAGVVSDSNLVKIREGAVRAHETALRQNSAWMSAMRDAAEDGRDQRDWLRSPEMTAKVTREELRDAARKYLRRESMAVFTLVPEAAPSAKTVPEQ